MCVEIGNSCVYTQLTAAIASGQPPSILSHLQLSPSCYPTGASNPSFDNYGFRSMRSEPYINNMVPTEYPKGSINRKVYAELVFERACLGSHPTIRMRPFLQCL